MKRCPLCNQDSPDTAAFCKNDGYAFAASDFEPATPEARPDSYTLAKLIATQAPLPIERAVRLAILICQAAKERKQKGGVIGPLRPVDVFITRHNGKEVVTVRDQGSTVGQRTSHDLVIEAAGYVAPEVIQKEAAGAGYLSAESVQAEPIDHRSDVYSIGVMLYEMLTGQPPFTATSPAAVMIRQLLEQPLPLRDSRQEIREELERVVLRALAREVTARQQSCTELRQELESTLQRADQLPAQAQVCPECGWKTDPSAEFCRQCGSPFRRTRYGAPDAAAYPQSSYQEQQGAVLGSPVRADTVSSSRQESPYSEPLGSKQQAAPTGRVQWPPPLPPQASWQPPPQVTSAPKGKIRSVVFVVAALLLGIVALAVISLLSFSSSSTSGGSQEGGGGVFLLLLVLTGGALATYLLFRRRKMSVRDNRKDADKPSEPIQHAQHPATIVSTPSPRQVPLPSAPPVGGAPPPRRDIETDSTIVGKAPAEKAVLRDTTEVITEKPSPSFYDLQKVERSKRCPQCGTSYPATTKFCGADGQVLVDSKPLPPQDREADEMEPVLIGQYQCFARLGEGGMGIVYKARHVHLERLSAVKVLLPHTARLIPNAVQMFRREARLASSINHPNSVIIYDYGEVGATLFYLAMEFIPGKSLAEVMAPLGQASQPLSLAQVFEITSQICDALDAAHQVGIIHRDLKPQNVMIGKRHNGTDLVKVVDFGIARSLTGAGDYQTTPGMIVGTPAYMSPEQANGLPELDARSDIFSLALMVWEMLSGRLPFPTQGLTPIQQVMQRASLTTSPPPLSRVEPELEIPAAVDHVLLSALEPDRQQRTSSIKQFRQDLQAAVYA